MMLLLAFGVAYVAAIGIALVVKGHHKQHSQFVCVGCANRRRIVRVGILVFVGLSILIEGAIHWPDLGFLVLAVLVEVT